MNRSLSVLLATTAVIAAAPALVAQQAAAGNSMPRDCMPAADSTVNHATMDHAAHAAAMRNCAAAAPTMAGQAAFGAISEVVRMLKADPGTDWSRVNIEALRQHLIDMDLVTMQSSVVQRNVPGGLEMDVTGTGKTVAAIKRMAMNHTKMLDRGSEYAARATELPNGARIVVTAKNGDDTQLVTRIRGLGFAGLMTEGDHHAPHHLALAGGDANPHGH